MNNILGECWKKDQLNNGFHCLFDSIYLIMPLYVMLFLLYVLVIY
jgi:hypothetical protein